MKRLATNPIVIFVCVLALFGCDTNTGVNPEPDEITSVSPQDGGEVKIEEDSIRAEPATGHVLIFGKL